MRKKSSKSVSLVLISSLLALSSCSEQEIKDQGQKVYMRADSTAKYTQTQVNQSSGGITTSGVVTGLLMYHAFRNMGGGNGYASSGLSHQSNVGLNSTKSRAYSSSSYATSGRSAISTSKGTTSSRGGFGSSSRSSVSS